LSATQAELGATILGLRVDKPDLSTARADLGALALELPVTPVPPGVAQATPDNRESNNVGA
jgi:hypothetical protein